MEGLHFEITADNSNFIRKVREVEDGVKNTSRAIEQSGLGIEELFSRMTKAAAAFGAGFSAKELISNIVQVRGEFQQLEVAFKTMLGSSEKADALMQQLVRTAASTPFDLQGVAGGAKQLLAYGLEAEKVNETLIRLGDIAAGLSIPLGDLVYLYGTTMTQGRLYAQDMNQFMGRGIPLADELAKQFGVSKEEVKELVSAGKVGFAEVQKAIESLTGEGGKFGGLMEAQSKTITGQISNIEDGISNMFNDMGKASEGIINEALSGVSYLVENYEQFGRMLAGLVATYGAYKAAVMTVTAVQAAQKAGVAALTVAEAAHYSWLVLVEKAQKLLNKTMLNNPYVLTATLIVGVVAALASMKNETERLEEAEKNYEEQKQKVIEAEEEHKRKMEELCDIAGDEAVSTDTRRKALNELEKKYPDIFSKYDTEYDKLKNIKKIKEEIAALEGQKSITQPKNELADVEKRIKELESKTYTKTVFKTNKKGGLDSRQETYKAALTSDEKAELETLKKKRGELKTTIRKEEVDAFFTDLTGISNEDLEKLCNTRMTLLSKVKMLEDDGKVHVGKITGGKLAGTYTEDELKAQINKIESELNRRNGKYQKSNAEWVSNLKETYEKAKKEYDDYVTNMSGKVDEGTFMTEAKKKKAAMDKAKKAYDAVKPTSGGTSSKGTKDADREAEEQLKAQEKLGEELVALERQNKQDVISAMEEGTEKKLAQIAYDYEQRKKAIEKQREEWKTANAEAGITDVGEDGLTEKQRDEIEKADNLNEDAKKKADAEVYRELVDSYQSYTDQRLAIERKFNEDIIALQEARKKAEEQGDTGAVEKIDRSIEKAKEDKGKAIASHDYEMLERSPEYVKAFEDLSRSSDEMLKSLIRKFEGAKEEAAKVLDPQDLKMYTDTLQQMYNELDSRNPFKAVKDALQELGEAQKEIKNAQDVFDKVKKGNTVINEDTGKAYTEEEASERLTKAKDKELDIYSRLTKAVGACGNKLNQLSGLFSQLGDMVGGKLGGAINEVGGILGSAGNALESIKNFDANSKGLSKVMGQASIVMGVADTMMKLNSALDKVLPSADSMYERYAAKQKAINDQLIAMIDLEIAQLEDRLNAESWFYSNGMTDLRKNGELYKEYLEAYGEVEAMPQEIYKDKKSGIAKWGGAIVGAIVGVVAGVFTFGAGSALGVALGTALSSLGSVVGATIGTATVTAIGAALFGGAGGALGNAIRAGVDKMYYEPGQTAAVNNMRVETRSKNFWHGQKTQDLESWVKDNWDEELFRDVKGVKLIDPEVARKVLEEGPKLVGETEETLEKLTEYSEEIDNFLEQVHDQVSDAFGPLVDDLTDALWDWLENGEDVMDNFKEYAAETFKTIAKDALKAMVNKQIFEPFQEQLEDLTIAYSTGQINEVEYMAGVSEFAKQAQTSIETQLPVLQNAAQIIDKAMENAGIDITPENSERTATAQGIAQASQDSVDELNGRFTAIQGHTYSISENMVKLAELQNTHLPLLQNLSLLAPIEENTYYCRRLEQVEAYTLATKKTLENIELIMRKKL